jgi:fluoroquinolone resistance protein
MESEDINQTNFATIERESSWFRYCNFIDFSMEGGHITSDFVGCSFRGLDLYWTMFNIVNFIDCRFTDCVFRGVAFPQCRFVECTLVNCRFNKDNLNGDCDFDKSVAYGCTINGCEGFAALIVGGPRDTATVFST